MRQKSILLAGNWKMNHGPSAAEGYFSAIEIAPKANAQMRIYPPFLSLSASLNTVEQKKLPIQIGAQNLHFEKTGAFTGEVSGPMLQEIGITQVLIGHSERRQYFAETDETVLKKTISALNQGFEVLLCVGETLEERKSGTTNLVMETQLKLILSDEICKSALGLKLHIAYEPVWAIGTGLVATPEQAEETQAYIRSLLVNSIGAPKADTVRLLYGGSVTPANFKDLLACPNIDGGLVGGASLKPESWMALWNLI